MNAWILLMTASVIQAAVANDADSCDNTKMMNCLLSMSDSNEKQRLFFPDTPEKLKDYCRLLMKGLDCARGFIDRCVSENDKLIYQNLTNDMVGMNIDLCTEGSPLSSRFLTHVNCFKELSDKFKVCSDRYIGNIVAVHGKPQEEQILMTCCTVHEYSRCMRNVVIDRCEKEASELVEDTVVRILSSSMRYCSSKTDVPTTNCRKNFSAQHSLSSTTYGDGEEENGSHHPSNYLALVFSFGFIVSYLS